MNQDRTRFLTAWWRHLAILNYEVDPEILGPYLPAGLELDLYRDTAFVSVVGFMFEETRLLGLPIPFHQTFEEVNLRFYVKRDTDEGTRRGVVFIREIVPRLAIALVARVVYNENYIARRMFHEISIDPQRGGDAVYRWSHRGETSRIEVAVEGSPSLPDPGSEHEFIAEHYWGYARQRDGSTVEYQVDHPPWRVWDATRASFHADVASLYGEAFVPFLDREADSAFLAEGSPVTVFRGEKLLSPTSKSPR